MSAAAAAELEEAKIRLLRDHVGPEVGILLDGHMGHREGPTRWDAVTALAVLDAVAPYGLVFFEEPLAYHDLTGYAELGRRSAVPVAGGEQLCDVRRVPALPGAGGVRRRPARCRRLGMIDFVRVSRHQQLAGRFGRPARAGVAAPR